MEIISTGSSPISISSLKGKVFNQEFEFPGTSTLAFLSAKIVRLWGDPNRAEDVMVNFVLSPVVPGSPEGAVYGTTPNLKIVLSGDASHFLFQKGKYLFFMKATVDGKDVDCIENSYYVHE